MRGLIFSLALAAAGLAQGAMDNSAKLIKTLQGNDVQAKLQAIETLGRMRAAAKTAVPALIQSLGDDSISAEAAQALADVGREAVPPLIAAVKDRKADAGVREGAMYALALMGPRAADAVTVLTESFQTADPPTRCAIAETLGCIGPSAKTALPALSSALKAPSPSLRLAAAMAIWKIGRRTDGVVPTLVQLLESGKRQDTKEAKEKINVSRSINPPSKLAVWFLGEIGPEAKSAVPALIKTLREGDVRLRGPAAEALGKIGPDAKTAIPALAAVLAANPTVPMILRDCDSSVVDLAGGALCKMGPNGVARILPLFDNESEKARELACQLISETGPSAKPYVSHLVAALRDKSPAVRRSAAEALGKLALEPRQAVPALVKKLNDSDRRVRAAACWALGGFRGSAACGGGSPADESPGRFKPRVRAVRGL